MKSGMNMVPSSSGTSGKESETPDRRQVFLVCAMHKVPERINIRTELSMFNANTSSTRTRQGGSCLKDINIYIYKNFLIYRTCMRRAPAKPVRACTLRNWCLVSHVTFEAPLRSLHFALHTSHFTLHSSHSTLHTSHSTFHTALFALHTSHFALHTALFALHTSHFTLRTSHFTLHSSHSKLHTSHSTLHLIWALLTLSQLISSHLISSHMPSKLSWITSQYYFENLHAPCASQAHACVLCAKLLQCCCPRTWPARDPGAMQCQANTFLTLHIAFFTPHTPHFTLALHLNSPHLSSSHLISCLPICQLSSS